MEKFKQRFARDLHACVAKSDTNSLDLTKSVQMSHGCNVALPACMDVNVILDSRRPRQDGAYPIKLRYRFRGSALYYTLPISVLPQHFDNGVVVGVRSRKRLNATIEEYKAKVQAVLDYLIDRGKLRTFSKPSELKRFVDGVLSGRIELEEEETMEDAFSLVFRDYIREKEKMGRGKYAESLQSTLTKITSFDSSALLSDITAMWLRRFETFCLSSGMSTNGVAVYLRNIRTIVNYAIDMELIPLEQYPFRRFSIKTKATRHRNLSREELAVVLAYEPKGIRDERAKDIFLLSLFLCGMNVKDLALLKKKDVRGNRIETLRAKTGEPISVEIPTEAEEIIRRNAGSGERLLNLLEVYSDIDDVARQINKGLRCILPHLTTYYARHTWATIAGELDIPDPVIDMAQGRSPQGITARYVKRNLSKVDIANRKVIDWIKGCGE